ncbi:MAG TPA: hypothetical protein PLB36_00875 [Bacillota bacterium]|nr:hypothetical protein [Candidatus Fermentithermobacillaceae bacterium]HOB31201.1 hypothetical protein [Bacillota bacterium]HOK63891.1 hypothetical protein [Bacillota bacterium]HOL11421.1 hypothetical protein [Bacillota bacterium]HPP61330.1 hypothetical protein [Bacillota bacterium]
MNRSYIGFLFLSVMCSYLYIGTVLVNLSTNVLGALVVGLTYITALLAIISELRHIDQPSAALFTSSNLNLLLSVILGALVTYLLNAYAKLGPVVASGLVTLLSGIFLPALGPAITCGSFVGMTSANLLGLSGIFAASFIAGLVFLLASEVFNGFGGKLGTIAATGTALAAFFTGKPFLHVNPIEPSLMIFIVLTGAISSALSFFINNRLKKGGVIASGLVALVGGIFLPLMFPQAGGILTPVCACGSYVGMSSISRLPDELFATIAGVLSGFAYYWGILLLGGAGGRLGTTAFGSVLAVSFIASKMKLSGRRR